MLINDNGVTREATPEEEEKYSAVDPAPVDEETEQKAEAYDYLTGRTESETAE